MAYVIIPKTKEELNEKLNERYCENFHLDAEEINDDVNELYDGLRQIFPNTVDPISMDDKIKVRRNVKIFRSLEDNVNRIEEKFNIKFKVGKSKFKGLHLTFGNGSRGGRGRYNKGEKFEADLTADFINLKHELRDNVKYLEFLENFLKAEKITLLKTTPIEHTGPDNNNRPLQVSHNGKEIRVGKDEAIGDIVADIIVDNFYNLSLKYGGTNVFANTGISTVFIKELMKDNIIEEDGLKILKMFGIDKDSFCGSFNYHDRNVKTNSSHVKFIVENPKCDKHGIENFIKSAIGFGYYLIHNKGKRKVEYKYISKKYINDLVKVDRVVIEYPKPGEKVINVKTYSDWLNCTMSFNSNKPGEHYPNRILTKCKFKTPDNILSEFSCN